MCFCAFPSVCSLGDTSDRGSAVGNTVSWDVVSGCCLGGLAAHPNTSSLNKPDTQSPQVISHSSYDFKVNLTHKIQGEFD